MATVSRGVLEAMTMCDPTPTRTRGDDEPEDLIKRGCELHSRFLAAASSRSPAFIDVFTPQFWRDVELIMLLTAAAERALRTASPPSRGVPADDQKALQLAHNALVAVWPVLRAADDSFSGIAGRRAAYQAARTALDPIIYPTDQSTAAPATAPGADDAGRDNRSVDAFQAMLMRFTRKGLKSSDVSLREFAAKANDFLVRRGRFNFFRKEEASNPITPADLQRAEDAALERAARTAEFYADHTTPTRIRNLKSTAAQADRGGEADRG